MKTTTVALGSHFDAFIQACVQGGRYTNASEVIRAGLRRLEEDEQKIAALHENGLKYVIDSDMSDSDLLSEFVSSNLPKELMDSLKAFIKVVRRPLAVRSSSRLEDSYHQPFAGVYSTYMLPWADHTGQQLRLLSKAIKSVYASVFFSSAKSYIQSSGNVISEEKMAIVIQEVCGSEDHGFFFPTVSGVARSINFYPVGHETAEDGIVKVAYGLGKAVVDGEQVLRFLPLWSSG